MSLGRLKLSIYEVVTPREEEEFSPGIIPVIKKMRWIGYLAHMGKVR
jgi:hypothetical protein